MQPNSDRLNHLFQRFLNDTANPEEIQEFWNIMSELEDQSPIKDSLRQLWSSFEPKYHADKKDWSKAEFRLKELLAKPEKKSFVVSMFSKRRIAVAAAILVIGTLGTIWVINSGNSSGSEGENISGISYQIAPGTDKAVLTLSDGSVVELDSAGNRTIAQQGTTGVIQQKNGQLVYGEGRSLKEKAIEQFNTVNIPTGGQYRLTLSDGTLIWLNSETRITFPVHFTGEQRVVQLTGEAYFEVKHNGQPFVVRTNGIDVNVLGTKFNVSSYQDDDAIVTTLTEGKVSVKNQYSKTSAIINPGEQVFYNRGNNLENINKVDTYLYTAWKDGKFYFKKEKLGVIMKKISRWYDVSIEIKDPAVANKTFTGVALRNRSIEHLLNMINLTTEIKYKVEGNKLIILSN